MNGASADTLGAGTEVEVDTTFGSYRGTLTQPHQKGSDAELRCAGHYVRIHRGAIRRVRARKSAVPTR